MAEKIEISEIQSKRDVPGGINFASIVSVNDVIPARYSHSKIEGLPIVYLAANHTSDPAEATRNLNEQPRESTNTKRNTNHNLDIPMEMNDVTPDKDGNRTQTKHERWGNEEKTVDPHGREIHRKFTSWSKDWESETTTSYDQSGHMHRVTQDTIGKGGDHPSTTEKKYDETANGWTRSESTDGQPTKTVVHEKTPDGYTETTTSADGTKTTTQRHFTDKGWSEHTTVDAKTGRTTMDKTYDRSTNQVTEDRVYPDGTRTHAVENPDIKL